MWRLYVALSLLFFVLASGAGVATLLWPPEQHGRGMGAALVDLYVMAAWAAAGLNLVLMASIAYFRWAWGPKPPARS